MVGNTIAVVLSAYTVLSETLGHSLFIALVTVGVGGYIIQRLALRWQHEYWERQHRIIREKEIRDADYTIKIQAYKDFSNSYNQLLGSELDERWESPEHPTLRLIASSMAFFAARDLLPVALDDSSEAYKLLIKHSNDLKPIAKDIAVDTEARAEYLKSRDHMIREILVALIKDIKHTRSE